MKYDFIVSFSTLLNPLKVSQYHFIQQTFGTADLERKAGVVFVLHAHGIKEINLNERHN